MGELDVCPGLSFPAERTTGPGNASLRGAALVWGRGSVRQCGQCAAASLTFITWFVLVSVAQEGASALSLCSRIFAVGLCPLIVVL